MRTPGEVIDGRYVIEKRLARGGMSNVYLAHSLPERVPWVIKEVPADHPLFFHAVRSLDTEITLLKHLDHPGLVKIVDALIFGDAFLMVTEYVPGTPLSTLLKKEGALDEETVAAYAQQICDAVGYLHSREDVYLYCDLKPSNLMVTKDGRIVLIDFGTVTKSALSAASDRARLGTQGYAAPEQYREGARLSEATDVYALGCTMRAMLSGGNPYERRLKGVSRPMKRIILRCTHKRPARRYRQLAEAEVDLRNRREGSLAGRMRDAAVIILFLMFFLAGTLLGWRILDGLDDRAVTAISCLVLAAFVFVFLRVPDAILRLLGLKGFHEARRIMKSARINGVFRVGKNMPTKRVISWQDVEIPLDEPMTDVRIDYAGGKVNFVVMNGFVLEKDVFVSLREHYTV